MKCDESAFHLCGKKPPKWNSESGFINKQKQRAFENLPVKRTVSVRRKDGKYYKRNSLLSVRAALDRHLKSPPYNKNVSFRDDYSLISEGNKTLNSYLKWFVNEGKIARTVLKNPS